MLGFRRELSNTINKCRLLLFLLLLPRLRSMPADEKLGKLTDRARCHGQLPLRRDDDAGGRNRPFIRWPRILDRSVSCIIVARCDSRVRRVNHRRCNSDLEWRAEEISLERRATEKFGFLTKKTKILSFIALRPAINGSEVSAKIRTAEATWASAASFVVDPSLRRPELCVHASTEA